MLTTENLKGVFMSIDIPWDDNDNIDEKALYDNIQKYIPTGLHGIYTTGTTGEFYALNFDEFKQLVEVFSDSVKGKPILTQVGCTAISTKECYRMCDYVASKGNIDGIQIALPFWMALTDEECDMFFKDICLSFPQIGFVHYNTMRAKRLLTGPDYKRIRQSVPNLIGAKFTGSGFYDLAEMIVEAPEMSFFVGEDILAPAMMFGAKGTYTSLALGNPYFILDFYRLCENREWEKAIDIQKKIQEWFVKVAVPMDAIRGYKDSAGDRAIRNAGGFLIGYLKCRKPYVHYTEAEVEKYIEETRKVLPEFIYGG